MSTSTRNPPDNQPNRPGLVDITGADMYLASVAAVRGKLSTSPKYMEYAKTINSMSGDIYRYMNFDKMPEYTEQAGKINVAQLA